MSKNITTMSVLFNLFVIFLTINTKTITKQVKNIIVLIVFTSFFAIILEGIISGAKTRIKRRK